MTARIRPRASVRIVDQRPDRSYARHVRSPWWRSPLALDVVPCAAIVAYAAPPTMGIDAPAGYDAGTAWDTVLLPLVVLPVLLRRRAPFLAAAAFAAGCVASGVPTFDQFRIAAAIPAALLVVFALARRAERGPALAGLALVLAGLAVVGATDVAVRSEGGGAAHDADLHGAAVRRDLGGRAAHEVERRRRPAARAAGAGARAPARAERGPRGGGRADARSPPTSTWPLVRACARSSRSPASPRAP